MPLDRRSDMFSLGIVLYELLTGERLFVGESDFSTLEKVRNVEILPPSTYNRRIPDELERIVLKALAKDVDDRYQNAIDLHDELQAFVYTAGEFYSRKDLAGWMKKTFGQGDRRGDREARAVQGHAGAAGRRRRCRCRCRASTRRPSVVRRSSGPVAVMPPPPPVPGATRRGRRQSCRRRRRAGARRGRRRWWPRRGERRPRRRALGARLGRRGAGDQHLRRAAAR